MKAKYIFYGIVILIIVVLLFLWRVYECGANSVRGDLPRREEALEKDKAALSLKQKELNQLQQDLHRKECDLTAQERRIEEKTHCLESTRQRDIDEEVQRQVAEKLSPLIHREESIAKREANLDAKFAFLDKAKAEALSAIPWLAKAYADLDAQKSLYTAMRLETKNPPAFVAADKVREAGRDRREAIYLAQQYKLQIDYFTSLFPWLEDYLLLSADEVTAMTSRAADDATNNYNSYAAVKEWLSPDEYDSLPNSEKWQLALDRYNQRHKTNWQIGIDYERYIGYLCEQHGYTVRYNGATKGLEDMGRDLIVENGKRRFIIQCKRWAKEKTIHEKHIFQLYGTCILYRLQNKDDCDVTGVFVTTTTLSDLARECAQYLKINVYENIPAGEYPQIKCNISKDGEKIYHLPFDQQYDRTLIKPNTQDFYAFTVQEAEQNGFRRAFRWHGN